MHQQLTTGVAFAKSVNAASRSVDAVVSSETIDRHGEIVDQGSWRLDNYRRNPVVLFGHDHGAPIGRADDLAVKDGKLHARIVFASTPRGDEILTLFAEKALRAFSVGFRVGRVQEEQTASGSTLRRLCNCDLWEISAVAVPANPDAVAKCKSLGLVPESYEYDASRVIAEAAMKAADGGEVGILSTGDASGDISQAALRAANARPEEQDQIELDRALARAGL